MYTRRKLLANAWARGAALQCCFSQELIYFLIPLYHGSVHPDSKFDPSRLSAVMVQIKNKVAKNAEPALRPTGVPRDRHQPLPYLVILMELGNEFSYDDSGSKIKYAGSEPSADGEFGILCDAYDALETYRNGKNTKQDILEDLKKKTNAARLAVDLCNRYLISVRGLSPDVYGILREAKIEKEFATLVSITMPLLGAEEQSTRQHMRPLERLSYESPHTPWMSEYAVPDKDGDGRKPT